MNARKFLILFIVYTLFAFAALLWHISIDAAGASGWVILHIFNIVIGGFGIGNSVSYGVIYGWKS